MRKYKSHIVSQNTISIIFNDTVISIIKDNPIFDSVKEALNRKDYNKACELVDVETRIALHTQGKFTLKDGLLKSTSSNEELPPELSTRLHLFIEAGEDVTALEAFWNNLKQNPSEESRKDLYGFLEHNGIPITMDGCFIAYKRVTDGFRDIQTGKFDNSVGSVVSMPRENVDADRNRTCSSGLHVAAFNYANTFYSNGYLLEVKVNPKNVVAVPTDYNNEKMRVCEYEVLRVADGERKDVVYTNDPNYRKPQDVNAITDFIDEDDDYNEETDNTPDNDLIEDVTSDEDKIADDDGEKVLKFSVKPDKDGRVRIPKAALENMQCYRGDVIYAVVQGKKLLISSDVVQPGVTHRTYTIDVEGRMKLSPAALKDAKINGRKSYRLTSYRDYIRVD